MTVTITVGTAAGLNYDEFLGTSSSSFLYNHTANPAYGEFYGTAHNIFGGPQHLLAASAVDGTVSTTEKAVLATGDFDYNFNGHTLDGTLNKVEFGYGPKLNTAGVLGADSYVTLDTSTQLTIDGLDLTSTGPGANTTHSILYGFISDTAAPLTSYLATLTSGLTFVGNAGADTFTGYGYDDIISGGGGADTLNGAGGNDTINGGAGTDTLTGSTGNDTFVFSSVAHSSVSLFDTITQFVAGEDKINVSALNLSGGFSASGPAVDSIWYDSTAGKLFADFGGTPAADFAIAISSLSGAFSASDFIV